MKHLSMFCIMSLLLITQNTRTSSHAQKYQQELCAQAVSLRASLDLRDVESLNLQEQCDRDCDILAQELKERQALFQQMLEHREIVDELRINKIEQCMLHWLLQQNTAK